MGLDFTPFPHFSCSQPFDLSREMLVQHEYAPKSGSTVTSCRLDLEQRIIMLQIGPPRGKCRPDLLQYRQLNIEVHAANFQQPMAVLDSRCLVGSIRLNATAAMVRSTSPSVASCLCSVRRLTESR